MKIGQPLFVLALAVLSFSATRLLAAPPWERLLPFKRVEADPRKSYALTKENGPWLIMCASFAGEGSQKDAHDLVLELRRRYKLKAYTYRQKYDFSKPVEGLGINRFGDPKKMRHRQDSVFEEIAVLVGDFESVEDASLQKSLDRIKSMQPECLQIGPRRKTTQRFAGLRNFFRKTNTSDGGRGPMGSAIATTNPLLPKEYYTGGGVDQLVLKMNAGVPHSLLDCSKRYTVRIARFRGSVVLGDLRKAATMKSRLAQAAEKAHKLTMALRKAGVEAYEFHDRYESIVTVGSFNEVGSKQPDGRLELNPAVHRIMQWASPKKTGPLGSSGQAGLQPRSFAGIPFDIQPIPVEVPRWSPAADYARQ